jgi:uncharacterized protein YtpQ (UPF0354 family)
MSGSSILTAVFCCTNRRILDKEKKKTITYDAELLLGKDDNDEDQFINAIVHFFVSKGEMEPEEDIYHFIVGKIISIKNDTIVGDDQNVEDYDLELDAFVVCRENNFFLLLKTKIPR